MITEEREEELYRYSLSESNDPETQEWREHLTDEEYLMVSRWDKQWNDGIIAACKQILAIQAEREQRKMPTNPDRIR